MEDAARPGYQSVYWIVEAASDEGESGDQMRQRVPSFDWSHLLLPPSRHVPA